MSLLDIINKREASITKQLDQFEREFLALGAKAQKDLIRLLQSGEIDRTAVHAVLSRHGLYDIAEDIVERQTLLLQFSKSIGAEIGYKFAMTPGNIRMFDAIQDVTLENLSVSIRKYITDIQAYGIRHQLEKQSLKTLSLGLQEHFEAFGRRTATEAYTGMSMAVNANDKMLYENAGIERFIYVGPYDGKTRDRCRATLESSRQATGWTMEQVNNSETPFIEAGGYNCRHRWMAFTKEAYRNVKVDKNE
jgi:hypothetical protein